MPIQPGTKLGAYEVQEFIGRGAMGIVYRAYHQQLARNGAVKVLQSIAPDPDATARFRREAQSIALMRHPNILNVFDFGDFEGTPYMVVEYVPGGSLAERLRLAGPPTDEAAVKLLKGIAEGLDYAHSLGIVHRDVKPGNVLLTRDDAPVLADFGLAKLLQSASVKTMSGVTTGTPAYMAPEQVTGSAVGPAADRYALATIAYELLCGRLPFQGEGVMEILYAHVHNDPPAPSSHRPDLGSEVDRVLLRGLAKSPGERWESCAAMIGALDRALETKSASQPLPPPAAERTLVIPKAAPPPLAAPLAAPPAAPPARRRRLVALAAALILLAVLAGVFIIFRPLGPQLVLSAQSAAAGDLVVLTAHRLPAGQAGNVQLESTPRVVGSFRADPKGEATIEVRIPRDTVAGNHQLRLCWSGSCHASAPIRTT